MPPRGPEIPDFPASQLFLRRLAYSLVRDEALAEDLVQDTWAAWVENKPRGLAEPRAWLARVLRNRAFNAKRNDDRRVRRETLAGRPDPSAPETDGTLEAQAQLLESLRKLDEPYRSTLVQRYYHDLAPKEIAERSGTSLNTVKARLARGLARLREELDRRYDGDRRAWCHWLMAVGRDAVVGLESPEGRSPPPVPLARGGSTGLLTSLAGTSVLGKSVLVSAMLLSALTWILWRTNRPTVEPLPIRFSKPSVDSPPKLTLPRREPVKDTPRASIEETVAIPPAQPAVAPTAFAAPLPFEWLQFGGAATHDSFTAFRGREDAIHWPRVRFNLAGLAGQPTIDGTELYSGGTTLYRVDLAGATVHHGSPEVMEHIEGGAGAWAGEEDEWVEWLAWHGLNPWSRVAAAPALAGELVLARRVVDGSVCAFDRDLEYEQWHWAPSDPGPWPLSGCLVGDRFIVSHRSEVVALSAVNGSVEWRFESKRDGPVHTVPACDGDLVYFATEKGVVFALDLGRGKERWRREIGVDYTGCIPVAMEDRVVLVDHGPIGDRRAWKQSALRALQSYDGRELWSVPLGLSKDRPSNPGVGEGCLLVAGRDLNCYSTAGGDFVGRFQRPQGTPSGTPLWVGDSVYVVHRERGLSVHDANTGEVRWSVIPPDQVQFLDLVHAGDQAYVATSIGLLGLTDDPEKRRAVPGFVLDLSRDEEMEPRRRR